MPSKAENVAMGRYILFLVYKGEILFVIHAGSVAVLFIISCLSFTLGSLF